MEFKETQYKRCSVIKADGRLDSSTAPQLEDVFNKMIEKGRTNLILDASDLTFVSSAGWWTLVRIQKSCKGKTLNPGELFLVNLAPNIYESMKLVGLHALIKTFDDLTTAVGEF